MTIRRAVHSALFLLLAAGCATPEGTDEMSSVPADILQAISQDAANVTATDVSEVEVIMAKAVTWNDGSLGCPEPGMLYTQALVDGYQVVLRVADRELDYRVASSGDFRLCEDADAGMSPSSEG